MSFVISRFPVFESQLTLVQVEMLTFVFKAQYFKVEISQGKCAGPRQQLKTKQMNRKQKLQA